MQTPLSTSIIALKYTEGEDYSGVLPIPWALSRAFHMNICAIDFSTDPIPLTIFLVTSQYYPARFIPCLLGRRAMHHPSGKYPNTT